MDTTEKSVEYILRQLGQGETHDIVEEILKESPGENKSTIKKKVLKTLERLRASGRVTTINSNVERGKGDQKQITVADVWVLLDILSRKDLPPTCQNYIRIPNEGMVIEASCNAFKEWCEETYKVPTEVIVIKRKKIPEFEVKKGQLTLYMMVRNLKGIVKVEVGRAVLPSSNLSPATYMAKLVFTLPCGNMMRRPGTPIQVTSVSADGKHEMGKWPFALIWDVSLCARPDDASFNLLYYYEQPSASVSLLDTLLKDTLVETIRGICKKYDVFYNIKWFETQIYPKEGGGIIRPVGTEDLSNAIKNLFSAKRSVDLHLASVKKTFADLIIK